MSDDYRTPFERHQSSRTIKIDPMPEKENPYTSTGYVRLPEHREVIAKMNRGKRAPQVSPLLQEFMKKEKEGKR
jgi:hypothetical protein